MQIWAAVNEADVGRIVPGAPVTFTSRYFPGREFKGTVGKIRLNATMTQNVVISPVEVNTENPDKLCSALLPHGQRSLCCAPGKQRAVGSEFRITLDLQHRGRSSRRTRARGSSEPVPINSTGFSNLPKQDKAADSHTGVLWLRDGRFVRPLEAKIGASDGESTAVVCNTLREGQRS